MSSMLFKLGVSKYIKSWGHQGLLWNRKARQKFIFLTLYNWYTPNLQSKVTFSHLSCPVNISFNLLPLHPTLPHGEKKKIITCCWAREIMIENKPNQSCLESLICENLRKDIISAKTVYKYIPLKSQFTYCTYNDRYSLSGRS